MLSTKSEFASSQLKSWLPRNHGFQPLLHVTARLSKPGTNKVHGYVSSSFEMDLNGRNFAAERDLLRRNFSPRRAAGDPHLPEEPKFATPA